jgi:hypothetical protein
MTSAASPADDQFLVAFQTGGTFLVPARHSELLGTLVATFTGGQSETPERRICRLEPRGFPAKGSDCHVITC